MEVNFPLVARHARKGLSFPSNMVYKVRFSNSYTIVLEGNVQIKLKDPERTVTVQVQGTLFSQIIFLNNYEPQSEE